MHQINNSLVQRLCSLVKGCFTTGDQNNVEGNNTTVQVQSYGLNTQSVVYYPYGYYAAAPSNSQGVLFNLNSHTENQLSMLYDPQNRFKGVTVNNGEAIVGNQTIPTYVLFKNDGSIQIVGTSDVNINTSGNVNITSPLVTMSGDLSVSGDITSSGNITATGNMSATNVSASSDVSDSSGTLANNRAIYNSHDHTESGGGTTGAPNQPQ